MSAAREAHIASVIGGLQRVNTVVTAQTTAGIDRTAAIQNLYLSFTEQVAALQIRQETNELQNVIEAISGGPWSADQKRELTQLIVNVSTAAAQARVQPTRRKNQKCTHWQNFFTDAEWVQARASQIDNSLAVFFAQKATALGLVNPCEVTLFNMVKLIAFLQRWKADTIDQQKVKYMKECIQTLIKSQEPPKGLPYLVAYPFSAAGLPEAIKNSAFKDGSIPTVVNIPDLDTILAGTSPRGSISGTDAPAQMKNMMKMLKQVPKAQQQAWMHQMFQSYGARSLSPAEPTIRLCKQEHSAYEPMQDAALEDTRPCAHGAPHAAMVGVGLRGLFPPLKVADNMSPRSIAPSRAPSRAAAAPMHAIMDKNTDKNTDKDAVDIDMDNDTDNDTDKDTDKDDPLLQLEAAIKHTVKAKAIAKQGKHMKKPAGANSVLKRKPASAGLGTATAGVGMQDVFDRLKRLKQSEITYGAYTSRAFDTAKRRAEQAGACREDALAFGRANFAIAADMYRKLSK